MKLKTSTGTQPMFFPVDQFIDGKVKYQAEKIYAIADSSVHRWIKRGCVVVTEEVAKKLEEREIKIEISQPVFGEEKIESKSADVKAPPASHNVKDGEAKTGSEPGVEAGGADADKTPEAAEATEGKKKTGNKKNQ